MNKAKITSLCINATLCLPGLISAQNIQVDLDKMRDFNAVQTIYRNGVPHTDKQGNRLMKYDPEKSFSCFGSRVERNCRSRGVNLAKHYRYGNT